MSLLQSLLFASLQVAGTSQPFPAHAGTACILDHLAPLERREMGDSLLASEPMSDKYQDRVDEISNDCNGRLGLTDADKEDALFGTLASLIVERSGATLAEAGVPPDLLDAWFDKQSSELRSDMERPVPDEETDARLESLLASMEGNEIPADRVRQHARLVVLYLRSRSLLYRLEHGLSLGDQIPPAG